MRDDERARYLRLTIVRSEMGAGAMGGSGSSARVIEGSSASASRVSMKLYCGGAGEGEEAKTKAAKTSGEAKVSEAVMDGAAEGEDCARAMRSSSQGSGIASSRAMGVASIAGLL